MLERISGKIVGWQIQKGILTYEERAVYQYAYELLLNQAINILIAVLIAVVSGAPLPVLLFLLSYIPMRSFCGGYHADTNWGCTVVSALLICGVCWMYQNIRDGFLLTWYPLCYLISGYLVMRYAPVPDQNKPLDEEETVRYRKKSRILWGMEVVIGMIFYIVSRRYGFVLAVSHLILSVMLAVGKLKNESKKKL